VLCGFALYQINGSSAPIEVTKRGGWTPKSAINHMGCSRISRGYRGCVGRLTYSGRASVDDHDVGVNEDSFDDLAG
jgi:hypothetical protein